jgi:hypothetical protein
MSVNKVLVWVLLKDGIVVDVLMSGNLLRGQVQDKVARQQNRTWKDLATFGYKVDVAELNFDFLATDRGFSYGENDEIIYIILQEPLKKV